jgi:chemotaxis signal transduction protein
MPKKSQREWGSRLGLSLEAITSDLQEKVESGRTNTISILIFEAGGHFFGVKVEHTEGVVDCPKMTPIPGAPDGVVGVVSVRGRMTLVADFGDVAGSNTSPKLVLLRGDTQLGVLAERVEDVVAFKPQSIRESDSGSEAGSDAVLRIGSSVKHQGRKVQLLELAAQEA